MRSKFGKTLAWVLGGLVTLNPFLSGGMAWAGERVVRNPNADTYIQQGSPDVTAGSATSFSVESRNNNRNSRGLISFDLSSIAAGSTLKNSAITLTKTTGPTRTHNVFQVTSTWSEAGVTWNTQPSTAGTPLVSASTANTAVVFADAALDAQIQSWINTPANNFGLEIQDSVESQSGSAQIVVYASREAATSKPTLLVNYMRDATLNSVAAVSPSRVDFNWTMPGTASNYDGVLITGIEGPAAPVNGPADGTTYTLGDPASDGYAVVNTSSFNTTTGSIENGDYFGITPGTEYTFTAYTHDNSSLNGGASQVWYSGGVSATVTMPTSGGVGNWSYYTGTTSLASPVPTGSGALLASANDNFVRSMSDTTGVRNYTPLAGGAGDANGTVADRVTAIPSDFTSNPTCAGVCDVLYVSSADGTVHAFRSDTGTELWQSASLIVGTGVLVGSPAVQLSNYSGGGYPHGFDLVIVGTRNSGAAGTSNNRVYGLNGNTGAVVWTYAPANLDIVNATPYIDYVTNSAWITSYSNGGTQASVRRLSTATTNPAGVELAAITIPTTNKNVPGPATLNGEILYVLTEGGDVVAISTTSNTVIGTSSVGGIGVGYPLIENGNQSDFVVVSTSTGVHKRAFNRATNAFSTSWDVTTIPAPSMPVYSYYPNYTSIYVGASDGNLYKIANGDGTTTAITVNSGSVVGAPAFDEINSKIFVGDSSGHIYSFNVF